MSKTSNSLPSWREIAVPHEDVQRGTFQQAEFAADLSRVHAGKATAEYQDAELFFARTYVTEGMRLLLGSVIERITGQGGDPVIQLQTAFGGGKTHTLLAVYHMAKGEVAAHTIDALKPVLREQGVKQLPAARVAVLDGIQLAPDQPAVMDGIKVNTLWGQLAWQLGGAKAYALVKESDHSGTSPGKDLLAEILHQHGPCIILIDELVAYVRQFEEGQRYKGGTYDSNLSFMQALMEAVRAVPNAVLLASLPESDKEAGGARGVQALRALEHYFQRLQAVWKAVSSEESFEIVRRRLFQGIQDQEAVREVCRAFAKYHQKEKDELPQEVRNERYTTSMEQAYPIHPELFERLYVDWSTLENFQRTRGVLKLMAKVIHRLWKDGNNDPLIMPGNLPLYDGDVRNELLNYLPAGWDPVLERDIDGDRSEPWAIESGDARLGKVHAARRVARTIFLGSAPSPNEQTARGLPLDRVLLGAGVPGGSLGAYKDALRRMAESLHHLNTANDRYWYDTRPNLRREMESRKQRFDAVHDILPVVKDKLQAAIGNAYGLFTGTHVFTPSSDIMDDGQLRLVVLHPQHGHVSTGPSKALDEAQQILRLRGEQPRLYQNRLIFLAADQNTVERLYDQVRTMLAWKSIVTDYKDTRIVLDNLMARNADESFAQSRDALKRTVVDCFKYLLVPSQVLRGDDRPGDVQWEAHRLSSTAPSMIQEIERQLKENEHLIFEWAPVHLERILRKLFWKDEVDEVKAMDVWQAMLRYLYFPRLRNEDVFTRCLTKGGESEEFFGFAYEKTEQGYKGFALGTTAPILDGSLLLIEPEAALAYAQAQEAAKTAGGQGDGEKTPSGPEGGTNTAGEGPTAIGGAPAVNPSATKTRFFGTITLDPESAKFQFGQVVDELLMHFTTKSGVKVVVKVDIEAENGSGFDEGTMRTVRENARVLGFGPGTEFE